MPWDHISPIPGNPLEADIDCSGAGFRAKFVVGGDFDADGRTELAVAPEAPASAGNDFWVMKYDVGAGSWRHMAPIPNNPIGADIDCSGRGFAAKFALAADFDNDGADELVVVPDAPGSEGNDLWVMKFNQRTGSWEHMAPLANHPMNADIDCSGRGFAVKFAVVGDFDGDLRAELAIAPDAPGSEGNDLWVMKYVGMFPTGQWQHMAPLPNHPMNADIDCSGRGVPAKFAVVGDFDNDFQHRAELAIVPDATASEANDLWVMKYVGTFPTGRWEHMAPIPNHPLDADIDCSGRGIGVKFALAADFDGDFRVEIAIAPDIGGSEGNDFWVMKYNGVFPTGQWLHMAPIPNHPMDADIDCSGVGFAAKFALAANLDGLAGKELVIAPDTGTSRGNDLWVMKYVGSFPTGTWQHLAPIPNHPFDADIDCSGVGFPAKFAVSADFDLDFVDELVVAPAARDSAGNDLWVMKYFGSFPTGSFAHMTPIPNHPIDADIDCSSAGFPARFAVVGNFDGDAPEIMVAPEAEASGRNDFWVLGFLRQNVRVVNMIPNSFSGETNQDSEPNLAVNPANPQQIAGSAFTPYPGTPTLGTAPIFVSQNGGTTWDFNNIVPVASNGTTTTDITIRFGTTSNILYAGILRGPGNSYIRDILRTNNFLAKTPMTVLITRIPADQPYVEAVSAGPPGVPAQDHVYVGNEDRAQFGTGRTATVDLSQDATTPPPSGFTGAGIERRTTIRNGPAVRPAVHPDGTVYAVFYRWTKTTGAVGVFNVTADVIVVRDDNFGAGPNPFQALIDGGDGAAGVRVVTGRTVPFNIFSQPAFGQERLVASNLSIAVDPRDSRVVYIAWADRVSASDYTLHVRRSTDRGATWSGDLRVVTNATNPALAINSVGKVAFLYQALTGTGSTQRWDTHVELTTDDWRTPASDVFLATVPASAPVAATVPYIGDYLHIMAVGRTFYGIFSANNTPTAANFPSGVRYQRNANFATQTLLDLDNATPVAISIDPFFFSVGPRPRN